MPRPKEPIDLVIAKGNKHLTKAEIKQRRDSEIKVDCKNVKPPDYLPKKLANEFNDIASKLVKIGIMTELDEDCLARYLLSKQSYLQYTSLLNKAMVNGSSVSEMEKLANLQDKAFKQTQTSARDLGLTIGSRCKLVMPVVEMTTSPENKFNRFVRNG